ncbi:transposase [Muricoccus radiodurans]|uniref:transposase n=1 Tax=Muricoccus radiodurans TaxID=2231721 RepID=UPI003CEDBA94
MTPSRPWSPLSDAEWSALSPHLRLIGPGRPIPDLRLRIDALFRIAAGNTRWSHASTDLCRTATLARHFRRLAHAGLWTRLLRRIASPDCPRALTAIADWICAAHRRAARVIGLKAIVLARRLGLNKALPGPPWFLPDPDLSATVMRYIFALYRTPNGPDFARLTRAADWLMRAAAGRRRIPRSLIPV